MKKLWKDKGGFMSLYMIMWMSVLIPALLFLFIDISHYVHQNVQLSSVTNNASASAVTKIREELVPKGILEINESEANKVVEEIIQHDLQLNKDFSPMKGSSLLDKPVIQVYIVNAVPPTGTEVNTPAGIVPIKKPSVVVYAKYPVKGMFFNNSVEMEKIGVSQVKFREER